MNQMKRNLQKAYNTLLKLFLRILLKGGPPRTLNDTQLMFVRWNAKRLDISIEESESRFVESWKALRHGHRGVEFRLFNDLSYRLYQVFVDDTPGEVFDAYRFHAPMHFLRMLSKKEPLWDDQDPVIAQLLGRDETTILDFGCGLAQQSRSLAFKLSQSGSSVRLFLADIPTLRREFLIWIGAEVGIQTTFLECTSESPIPDLPRCDVCFSLEFFEHVHDPVPYLEAIHFSLNKGGLLITNVGDHRQEFMHVSPALRQVREQLRALNYEEILPLKIYRKGHL